LRGGREGGRGDDSQGGMRKCVCALMLNAITHYLAHHLPKVFVAKPINP